MIKKRIPEFLALQVAAYGLEINGQIFSASKIDDETIRIWYKNKDTNRVNCILKPYIKDNNEIPKNFSNIPVHIIGKNEPIDVPITVLTKSKNLSMFEEIS